MPSCSRKASTTCSASFLRIRPWSTKTQVSWSPTARWTSSAAVAESTPPERPQIDAPVADLGADRARPARRSPRPATTARSQPATSRRKRVEDLGARRGCGRPRGGTGSRRGRARCPRGGDRRARAGGERGRSPAAARRPCRGGSSSTAARPAGRRAAGRRRRGASSSVRPNSPASAPSTRPPSVVDHRLHPVTDAEHRDPELEQLGRGAPARPRA